MIGNFLSGTGGSRGVCEELADHLASEGWTVVTASRQRPKLLRLVDMIVTAVKCRHRYAVAQVDVFSGPAFFWAEAAGSILRRLGKPYALTLHGGRLPEFAARWPRRVSSFLGSAGEVTAPSAFLQQEMEAYRPGIRVIPNAIELGSCPFRQRGPAGLSLVWLRAFHKIYNPVMAVRAVGLLRPQHPDIRLIMVGPDQQDGSLDRARAETARLGLHENISFPGPVPKAQVPLVLNRADIFLNTSNFDNTPVSVIEAMACGLCVVSTNVGGLPYLLGHGEDALLVDPRDPAEMGAAVARLLTEPELTRRLSGNAHHKARRFEWSVVLGQWSELLGKLAH